MPGRGAAPASVRAEEFERLVEELADARRRAEEAEEALNAIRNGEVDGLVVSTPRGERVYSLEGADRPYRTFVEEMQQGALTVNLDGTILYGNRRFSEMMGVADLEVTSASIYDYVAERALMESLIMEARVGRAQAEVMLRGRSREPLPALLVASPSTMDDGVIILVVTDLTEQKRQEKLLASANLTRSILDQAADVILMCDTTGMILQASRGARELCGRNPVLQEFREILPIRTEGPDAAPIDFASVLEGKTYQHVEVVLRDGKGRPRQDLLFSAAPLRGGEQEIIGSVITLTDITERKKAEEALRTSETFYRTVGETIPFGIFQSDAEGNLTYFSPLYLEMLGKNQEELGGYWGTVHPEDREKLHEAWRKCVRSGSFWDYEFRVMDAQGKYRSILSRAVPVRDDLGRIISYVGTNLDVTERSRMREALKDADRRKDEFLAMLSHELRNPLAPILNGLSILKMPGASDSIRTECQDVIGRQVQQMVRMIDDLLDVSRITRGKITLRREPVDVADVISQAVETALPLINSRKIDFKVLLPNERIRINADRVRIAQITSNLLNNAAKYTHRGGTVELSVRRIGSKVEIAVRDTGIGIPEEMIDHIFDLFAQVDNSPGRAQGGLGIGLTVVKMIVEMHGGTVEARSAGRERGSEFVVRLPALIEAEPPRTDAKADREGNGGRLAVKRILIVDDNIDAAASCAMLLRLEGHQVRTANEGRSALELGKAFHPDVVLLDIGLPEMDGYEIARRMRSQPETREALLIAITGYGQEEDRRKSAEAGFDHHLVKPVTIEILSSVLSPVEGGGTVS